MRFSQRAGITPITKLVQRDVVDDELRASLWSLLTKLYWDSFKITKGTFRDHPNEVALSNLHHLVTLIWIHLFKRPTDTIDRFWPDCLARLRKHFFEAKWYEVYDFLEFVANNGSGKLRDAFIKAANHFLSIENSAYRFVEGHITEITSAEEVAEVERASANADRFAGTKTHLKAALRLLADRQNPDFRNSIKESISAVESIAKQLSGDATATLGSLLAVLEKRKRIHPALKVAFSSLYGYTSDSNGIRHALTEDAIITKAEARFMLISCSAFINYMIDESSPQWY
jgi:hypothetical protein